MLNYYIWGYEYILYFWYPITTKYFHAGAVKMLYELNNTDESGAKKKKTFYYVERAQKDIIKKANLLKNELEQTTISETQISLRKKEAVQTPSPTRSGPILERKMSKDSTKSSVSLNIWTLIPWNI